MSSIAWLCRWFALCGMLLALAGCASAQIAEEVPPATETSLLELPPTGSVGQSFVARHAGLQAVEILLGAGPDAGDGRLTLRLRSSPLPDAPDLRTATLDLRLPAPAAWRRFEFAPVLDTNGQPLYFFVDAELPPRAQLSLSHSAGSTYRDGALYVQGRPQDDQMAFRLRYNPRAVFFDLLGWLGNCVRWLLLTLTLFILPGLALQTYLLPMPSLSWKERGGIAAGLSLSLYPVILVWASVFRLRPGAATVWLPVVLAVAALAWRRARVSRHLALVTPSLLKLERPRIRLADVAWIAALLLVFLLRMFLLRTADSPLWGDSVQHAEIGQLLVDNGGLFNSWLPYAPYRTLTVHFGFHTVIAAIMWFTGAPVLDATLLAGQIVNFLAILTLVPLAQRLVRNQWAGLGVLVAAGLLSPLPHGYINWGRYSQLTGQAVMPVAVWFLWRLFDREEPPRRPAFALAALSWAGTFLAYYRMPHYVAAFFLALLVAYALGWRRMDGKARLAPLGGLVASGLLALVLLLPWLLRLRGSSLAEAVAEGVAQGSPLSAVRSQYQIFAAPSEFVPLTLVFVAGLATLWALLSRRWPVMVIALWLILVSLFPASRLVRLPGGNKLDGFAVIISLYIPVSLLAGYAIDAGLGAIACRGRMLAPAALGLLGLVAAPFMRDRLNVVDPAYRILAPADERAMEWIREHVAPDARFLVDGFLIYNGTSAVGSDGGWWLPLLTRRGNTMPPQYPLLTEQPLDPAYNKEVVDLVARLREVGVTSPEGISLLCRGRITHVYVGQGQGQVAIPPPEPMLPLAELERSAAFRAIYRQDKVGVFALDASACR